VIPWKKGGWRGGKLVYAEKTLGDEEPLPYTQQGGPTRAKFARWLILGEWEGCKVHHQGEIGITSSEKP
jgi:hypothetical protein